MLHYLEIENYMSIRDKQVLDLRVAENVVEGGERFAPIWEGQTTRVPKVIALFGPNASGKSTVLRALALVAWFVKESFQMAPDAQLPVEPSWATPISDRPTRIVVHFSGPDDLSTIAVAGGELISSAAECRYAYEVNFNSQSEKRVVVLESLHYWPSAASRKVRLFERRGTEIVAGKEFQFSSHRPVLHKILRENASVVATLAQLEHKPSLLFRNAASRIISNIFLEKHVINQSAMLQFYQDNPRVLESVNRDLSRIDLGIRSMSIETTGAGPLATFEHEGLSRKVPLFLESHGTRQFLEIYPILALALIQGGVAVVDELDLAIHPLVLPEILRWFYDPTRNPSNAQLWITCQNASLLEELAKEEAYFCEKDNEGATSVYGLKEIVGVRRVDNFYRKYMGGTYGAVPTLG